MGRERILVPLDPKQKRYLDGFFPGLIQAVEALGPGKFESKRPRLKAVDDDHIRAVEMLYLEYKFSDGFTLEIRSIFHLLPTAPPYKAGTPVTPTHWERTGYGMHYGKSYDLCTFRFDRDVFHGYHVHIRPHPKERYPTTDFTPDTRDMSPMDFVAIVKKFRIDHRDPIQRKKP
jgi:hypothetical protein